MCKNTKIRKVSVNVVTESISPFPKREVTVLYNLKSYKMDGKAVTEWLPD